MRKKTILSFLCGIIFIVHSLPLASETDAIEKELEKAEKLQQAGKYSDTIKILGTLYSLRPYHDRIGIRYALALIYREDAVSEEEYIEGCRKAANILKEMLVLHAADGDQKTYPFTAMLHFYRGNALWFSNQLDHALLEFQSAYKMDSSIKEAAIYNQAIILFEMGKMRESEKMMNLYTSKIK